MAVVRDESLSRSFMLVCLAAAALLISAQGKGPVSSSTSIQSPQPTKPQVLTPAIQSPATLPNSATHLDSGTHLVVDLSDRRVYVHQNNRIQVSYPIAVGQVGWETPTGNFKVMQLQRNPVWKHPITGSIITTGPNNPLGSRWIGFWSDGRNLIGFHGTNEDNLIGQAVSHGCLRMRNQDINALYEKITNGTPVTVKP